MRCTILLRSTRRCAGAHLKRPRPFAARADCEGIPHPDNHHLLLHSYSHVSHFLRWRQLQGTYSRPVALKDCVSRIPALLPSDAEGRGRGRRKERVLEIRICSNRYRLPDDPQAPHFPGVGSYLVLESGLHLLGVVGGLAEGMRPRRRAPQPYALASLALSTLPLLSAHLWVVFERVLLINPLLSLCFPSQCTDEPHGVSLLNLRSPFSVV